jgi:phospholipase D1/2
MDHKISYLLPKYVKSSYTNGGLLKTKCTCQVLRSISPWSQYNTLEKSIYNCYLSTIELSKHFIYIENQFFVSSTAGSMIHNAIADALVKRIRRAHNEGQAFTVICLLPLVPAFPGAVHDGNIAPLRFIMNWQYRTISRSQGSIWKTLEAENIDPNQYISFHSLRTYGQMQEKYVTEQIYVHSKIMLIDDQIALIGSGRKGIFQSKNISMSYTHYNSYLANINDRSMLGDRDSECGVLISDETVVESRMNGNLWPARKFAYTLRKALYVEHMGISPSDEANLELLDDPIKSSWMLRQLSQQNTEYFREIFRCMPDEAVHTVGQVKSFQKLVTIIHASKEKETHLNQIHGHIVDFPLNFLKKENLGSAGLSGILPEQIFT